MRKQCWIGLGLGLVLAGCSGCSAAPTVGPSPAASLSAAQEAEFVTSTAQALTTLNGRLNGKADASDLQQLQAEVDSLQRTVACLKAGLIEPRFC